MKLFIFVLICLFLCSFSDSFSVGNVDKTKVTQLEIPLTPHKSTFHRLLEMGISPHVIGSFFSKKRKPRPKSDVHNDTVQLFKHIDLQSEFYGEILLGKPGQKFKVVFDTAWGDSFVPSKKCSFYEKACRSHDRYDWQRSSTYVANGTKFEDGFESGNISGFLSQDVLHLGHINVNNQTFAEILSFPQDFLTMIADGIFGMGFQTLSKSGAPPFFYNVMSQYPNMPHIFSFYLNRDITTEKGGSLILGGISTKHYNTTVGIKYFPVVEPLYWTIRMSSAYFDHPRNTFCASGCNVFLDTGAATISVPKSDLERINNRIAAYVYPGTNRFEVDCKEVLKLPQINFVFNDVEFHLKGKEYIQEVNIGPKRTCLSAFEAADEDAWGLGGAFLYRHYAVFNVTDKAVGLAPALL